MTLATTISDAGPFLCNGATTAFSYAFRIDASDEVEVILIDADGVRTTLELTTDYSVSGVGNAGGGNVTTVATYATGYEIYLRRTVALEQVSAFENQSRFSATALETALDRLAMQGQYLRDEVDRAIQAPLGDDAFDDLPAAVNRAGNLFEFDEDGALKVDRSADEVVNLALSRVVAQRTLTTTDMATPAALQAAVTASPGLHLIVPRGTWPLDLLSSPTEIDLSSLAGLTFAPGAEIVSNNPVRGILRAASNTGLLLEGFRGRWAFLGNISRPDFGWDVDAEAMFDWIDVWNTAYGTAISTALNGQTLAQRWSAVYTSTPTAAWNQISASGRASGLLLNGCSQVRIFDPFVNNCVAQINDQGGVVQGDALNNFATYIDRLRMGNDQRFGYLFKRAVATYIEQVVCNVNGVRDQGGAPHVIYGSGNPDATPNPDRTIALQIGSAQITDWGIAPAIKVREATVNIGSIVGERTQSLLGLVHCTGSVGPITSIDQALARNDDGSLMARTGSKYAANFSGCYGMSVDRMNVQQRASTGPATQDSLRVADLDTCDRMSFAGIDVDCNRLTASAAMVALTRTTNCQFGPGSLRNTGVATVAMYEAPVDKTNAGGTSSNNSFAPVRCSTLATIGYLAGAASNNHFTVDPRQLADGYVEGETVEDVSQGASNTVSLMVGNRVVPVTEALLFETKASAVFILGRTDEDEDDDDPVALNFTNGSSVTVDGRTYTMRTTLTGSGDEVLIGTGDNAAVASIKRLAAALNNLTVDGQGAGQIYNNGGDDHDTYEAVASGLSLAVFNRVAGTAGNGDAVSSTETNGAWLTSETSGGGLLDRKYLNCIIAVTAGADNIAMPVPPSANEGDWVEFALTATGGGTVDCFALETLDVAADRLCCSYEDGAWRSANQIIGGDLAAATAAAQAAQAAAELARDEVEALELYRAYVNDAAALAVLSVGDLYRVLSADSTEIWELHRVDTGPAAVDTGKRFSDNSAWSANFDTASSGTDVLGLTDSNGFYRPFLGLDYLDWGNLRAEETATGFVIKDSATDDDVLEYDNTTGEVLLLGAEITTDDTLTFPLGLIDDNGFIVVIGDGTESSGIVDPTPPPAPVTIDPIYGDEFWAFEDGPIQLYADGLLDGRSATRPDAMVSFASWPFDGQGSQSVLIDPARCGATSVLSVRRLTNDIDKRREIAVTNRIASADGASLAGNVAIIGDSITNRRLPELVDDILTARGYVPTWIGTMECSSDETTTSGGGPLCECRESRAFADYIYSVITDAEVVEMADDAGETAAYIAGNKAYKRDRIPMLRPELPGDDAGVIKNGYVFDYDRYLTRFSLADPDVVVILLGTNDINEASASSALSRVIDGITVMHTQIRAALPTAHIVFGMPGTARTVAYDTQWASERAAVLKGFVSTIRALRVTDANVHYLAAHAHMSMETGWEIGDAIEPASETTGIVLANVTDEVHPKGNTRLQLAEQVAAAIAWCLEN